MMPEDYKTKLSLRVDWADLDLFGHVNNVAFFKYIQAARVNYCDRIGLGSLNNTELGFIVASTSCDFKIPLTYPNEITVFTKVETIGKTSITLNHMIINREKKVVAEGKDVLVVFNYQTRLKSMVTEDLKKAISLIENSPAGPAGRDIHPDL